MLGLKKKVYLGTANWGEGIPKDQAFQILDVFVEQGHILVDTATNYPINRKPEFLGTSLKWIQEWIQSNPDSSLKVFVKLGSIDNQRSPKNDLSKVTLAQTMDNLSSQLRDSLYGIGIHWDNRGHEDRSGIRETLATIRDFATCDIQLGLSGITNPQAYADSGMIGQDWEIQVKEFPGNSLARGSYGQFFPTNPYVAYGLSHYIKEMIGFTNLTKKDIYFQGIQYLEEVSPVAGYIVAPSNVEQAKELLNYGREIF